MNSTDTKNEVIYLEDRRARPVVSGGGLRFNWMHWNSGQGIMAWSLDIPGTSMSLHIHSNILILSSLTTDAHWGPEGEEANGADHLVVEEIPCLTLAGTLELHLEKRVAAHIATDIETIHMMSLYQNCL